MFLFIGTLIQSDIFSNSSRISSPLSTEVSYLYEPCNGSHLHSLREDPLSSGLRCIFLRHDSLNLQFKRGRPNHRGKYRGDLVSKQLGSELVSEQFLVSTPESKRLPSILNGRREMYRLFLTLSVSLFLSVLAGIMFEVFVV